VEKETFPDPKSTIFVEAAYGFAEVFLQHKYNVVEVLQQRGYLVAMTGDGVNDALSLKNVDTGIAVEGASDTVGSAAVIVFLAPGLSAITDALKTSRQIFHRMYAYVVYRIALSLQTLPWALDHNPQSTVAVGIGRLHRHPCRDCNTHHCIR
jgi:H+-transporting ATPase